MLEVKGLRKVYKNKKGKAVVALDGVDISFEEKGMVFLLGKSGSGKSTLLNLCGGLDAPTEGEIIVKGRSSKSFSQGDFDSYRNTFVGFIFQEYNILNEFSVEDNIALALELRGKNRNKEAVEAILERVDLVGYGKRKPNTLSGGQKQRVAIARALVKEPEIIMADEPTGALDSNTGKQVFDTLKKLSKEKLVIVVSHDREFAQIYGDRIVELKDGKIISDVSKTNVALENDENVSDDGELLTIKTGKDLTENDFLKIKEFLKKAAGKTVFAGSAAALADIKQRGMNEDGNRDIFVNTVKNDQKRQYRPEESRFIRSKLPLRHASRIGLSSLRIKPFRLVLTIILCITAFTMFGMASTLTFYNSERTFKKSIEDNGTGVIALEKVYTGHSIYYAFGEETSRYTYVESDLFTPKDVDRLEELFDGKAFASVSTNLRISTEAASTVYYNTNVIMAGLLPKKSGVIEIISGRAPEAQGEIMISSYLAMSLFKTNVLNENGEALGLDKEEDIVGKKILVEAEPYTVSGIFKTPDIPQKFDALKDGSGLRDYTLQGEFYSILENDLYQTAFFSKEDLLKITANTHSGVRDNSYYRRCHAVGQYDINADYYVTDRTYANISDVTEKVIYFNERATVGDNEIVISARYFMENVYEFTNRYTEQNVEDGEIFVVQEALDAELFYNDEKTGTYTVEECIEKLLRSGMDMTVDFTLAEGDQTYGETIKMNIAGIYIDEYFNEAVYVNEKTFDELCNKHKSFLSFYVEYNTSYVPDGNGLYKRVSVIGATTKEQIDYLWDNYQFESQDAQEGISFVEVKGGITGDFSTIDQIVEIFSKVFFYMGLVSAIFATMLFSNFIAISVQHKRREIGILRAVGARSVDVFKIFFSESFFISAICVVCAMLLTMGACWIINGYVAKLLSAYVFVFGPLSAVTLVGIAVLTAVVATFLPVYKAARKKPVESITSL